MSESVVSIGNRAASVVSGANLGMLPGTAVVGALDYGDSVAEIAALRHGCGLFDRAWAGGLLVSGRDARRFLNAYVTCELKSLGDGEGRYGFLTSAQGRILAALTVLAVGEDLWVELPPGVAATAVEHLQRYVIADRVEFRAASHVPLSLLGPAAQSLVEGLFGQAPETLDSHVAASLGDVPIRLQRAGRWGAPGFTVWVEQDRAADVAAGLLAAGAVPVGFSAAEVTRVEAGEPRFGLDFGPQNFPQETGQETAVSYTKGCYLGQEVVARIHYRGGVQKQLRGLAFEGSPAPPGAAVLSDGREAGRVGSSLFSPTLGRGIGLAILHRRAGAAGSRVHWTEGEATGEAEVCDLPFTPPPA